MAGMGAAPAESRRRTNTDTFAAGATTISTDVVVRAPALPGAKNYRAETRAWYATWAKAPQAAMFLDTDWQRLHMIAALVDRYYENPTEKRFSEIRQNESLLGATHLDRLRGRIKINRPMAPSKSGSVASLDERRARLMDDA